MASTRENSRDLQPLLDKIKVAYADIDAAVVRYVAAVNELRSQSRKAQETMPFGVYANECLRFSGTLMGQLRRSTALDRTLMRVRADIAETERLKAQELEMAKQRADRRRYAQEMSLLPPSDDSFDEVYSEVVDENG